MKDLAASLSCSAVRDMRPTSLVDIKALSNGADVSTGNDFCAPEGLKDIHMDDSVLEFK